MTKSGGERFVSGDGGDGPADSGGEDVGVEMIRETLEQLVLEGGFGQEAIVEIGAGHYLSTRHFHSSETNLETGFGIRHSIYELFRLQLNRTYPFIHNHSRRRIYVQEPR